MSATPATLSKLLAWRPGGYLRASGALFGWLALRTAAQTALFVLVARTLGADGYGSLIAVMAIATFFAPLAGLGGQALLVRDGARNPENVAMYLGDALRLWALSIVPLCAVAFVTCRLVIPKTLPALAIGGIVLADLAGASLLELLARTWQTVHRMAGFGAALAGLILVRLIGFCLLLAVSPPAPASWAAWYGAITAAYVLLTAVVVLRQFGPPATSATPLLTLATAGFPFAFAGSAMRVQAEFNKPILAGVNTLAGVGVFSAAQRITDLVTLPLTVAVETLLPRAYIAARPMQTILRIGIAPMVASVVCGGGLILAAPVLPHLLGFSFQGAVPIVQMLALLPAVMVIRLLLTVAIAARDGQRHFLLAYGAGALASIVTTAWWVPLFGLKGAVAAAYATELGLIGIQGGLLVRSR